MHKLLRPLVAAISVTGFTFGAFLPATQAVEQATGGASASISATATPTALPSVPTNSVPKGDSIRAREYWLTEYGFTDIWKQSTGKGITVAVIDTGVDASHQDLTGNVLKGADVSGVGNKYGQKGLGLEPEHGTLVASMIAGHGHDAAGISANSGEPGKPAGIIGVAPDAKILPISLELGTTSSTAKSIDEQIPAAVRKAVDGGAKIINLSVGSANTSWPQSWDSAFAYAEEKGVLIVASSGNRGAGITQVGAPATIPGVLTVGGVDRQREESLDSSTEGISIAVAAPSEELVGAYPGNKYATWNGTSAAAPIVSGLAALIMQKYPNLTSNQVIQRIISSADDAGESGRDNLYGFGIINPKKALAEDTDQTADSNPLGSMSEWISVHRKQTQSASEEPSATSTPVHEVGEKILEAQAPEPVKPTEDSGILPFIVLGGLCLWTLIITLGSIYRLNKVIYRRRGR